ncbi:MAG: hypothetical protein HKN40_07765, partial [Winogradskyella sp.]|uniref:hypothetical protein n=1 Tax=Winogradskyella sp. TaxID=1883156 RepID=UPI0017D3B5B5|nr:hypothetical protein [Winogradskyella sp.]
FIVNEILADTDGLEVYSLLEETTEDVVTAESETPAVTSDPVEDASIRTAAKEYLVRLAAYKNPKFFNASAVSNLGVIEQRKSGDFTIMYVAGFSSLNAAKAAQQKAKSSGFDGAYLVENKNGEFVKVEM